MTSSFQNGHLIKGLGLKSIFLKNQCLVHIDLISSMTLSGRRENHIFLSFEILEYTFLLIGNSNYDEKCVI